MIQTLLKIWRQYGKYKDNTENMNAKKVAVKMSQKMNFATSKRDMVTCSQPCVYTSMAPNENSWCQIMFW